MINGGVTTRNDVEWGEVICYFNFNTFNKLNAILIAYLVLILPACMYFASFNCNYTENYMEVATEAVRLFVIRLFYTYDTTRHDRQVECHNPKWT